MIYQTIPAHLLLPQGSAAAGPSVDAGRAPRASDADGSVETDLDIPREVLQYADPDLAACGTSDSLLLLRSIEAHMPRSHAWYGYIKKLVDLMASNQITEVDAKRKAATIMASIRLGPSTGPYDPTFSDVAASLSDLGESVGIPRGQVKVVSVKEETPGRQGNITVQFSVPMTFKEAVRMMSAGML